MFIVQQAGCFLLLPATENYIYDELKHNINFSTFPSVCWETSLSLEVSNTSN